MNIYGDLHCDTLWRCYDNKSDLKDSDLQLVYGVPQHRVQTYAFYIPDCKKDPYGYFCAVYSYAQEMLKKYPEMVLCRNTEQIRAAFAAGKTPYLFSVEGGGFFTEDTEQNQRIAEDLMQKGITFFSLCYNRGNNLAGGVQAEHGLTALGRKVATMLWKAGISLDLSHLNRRSADELLALLPDGVVATHSNCYSLVPHKRNLTDEQIKELASRKGLVGVNFFPPFLTGSDQAAIEDILSHIRYMVELGGRDIIAMGSDFDGINVTPADLPNSMALPRLREALAAEWGAESAEAFMYGNMARYLEKSAEKSALFGK